MRVYIHNFPENSWPQGSVSLPRFTCICARTRDTSVIVETLPSGPDKVPTLCDLEV